MTDHMDHRRTNERVDALLADLARRQYGVFARRQALERDVSPRQIVHRLRAGRWTTILPNVYRIAGGPYTGRTGAMAAVLWAGPDAVLSHGAAAMFWEFEGVRSPKPEVWIGSGRRLKSEDVVVHRGASLDDVDRAALGSIPITTPARTLIDVSGRLEDEALLALVEHSIRRGVVTERSVAERVVSLRSSGRPGIGRLAALLAARPPGARALESRLEARFWRLILTTDLPVPVRQHWVVGAARRYRLDFAWPDVYVAVECEGRAFHDAATAERDDRRRGDLASLGWRVIPVTWRQLTREHASVVDRVARSLRRAA